MFSVIGQIGVDFVGNHNEIVLLGKLRDGGQSFPRHDRSGRVVRISDQQGFGPWGHGCGQLIDGDAKLVFAGAADADRSAAGQRHARLVGNVTGFRHQYFVSGG